MVLMFIVIGIIAFIYLFIYCVMKTASDADDKSERDYLHYLQSEEADSFKENYTPEKQDIEK